MTKPKKPPEPKPSPAQVLAAKIRLERERFEKKHRVRCEGGWLVPGTKESLAHLEKVFGIPAQELSFYFTYSRYCTHPWTRACHLCPVP